MPESRDRKEATELLNKCAETYGSELADILLKIQVACDEFEVAHRKFLETKAAQGSNPGWFGRWVAAPLADWSDHISGVTEHGDRHVRSVAIGGAGIDEASFENAIVEGLRDRFSFSLIWGFEAFERALRQLLATVGYLSPSIWLGSSKLASLGDHAGQPLAWFLDALRWDSPGANVDCLRQLRRGFPETGEAEENSDREFRLRTMALTKLRHLLTHGAGDMVFDDLVEALIEESGLNGPVQRERVNRQAGIELGSLCLKPTAEGRVRAAWFEQAEVDDGRYGDLGGRVGRAVKGLADHWGLFYVAACARCGVEPMWQKPNEGDG